MTHDPSPVSESRLAALIAAAVRADWMQVALNQGPPCFHYEAEHGTFCLRAERWQGHGEPDDIMHRFVSLADLLAALSADARAEARAVQGETAPTKSAASLPMGMPGSPGHDQWGYPLALLVALPDAPSDSGEPRASAVTLTPERERMFPIMGAQVGSHIEPIPWAFIAPHEEQAKRNHDQTLERLAQRGGLDPGEALLIVTGRPLRTPLPAFHEANRQLRAMVEEWQSQATQALAVDARAEAEARRLRESAARSVSSSGAAAPDRDAHKSQPE